MARCNAPRNVKILFKFAAAVTIPLSIWWTSHLGGVDLFPVLIGSACCLTFGAICAAAVVLRFKHRHSGDNYSLLTAGLFGVFIATNLIRFLQRLSLQSARSRLYLMTGSVIALASISGVLSTA